MELTLTEQEQVALHHALKVYLTELRDEIVKTEKHEWKLKLHEEEDLLKQVMGRLA